MNGMSLKEKAVGAILGMIVLYAVAAGLWFFCQESAWKKAAKAYRKARDAYRSECRLIESKPEVKESYEAAKANIPTFESGKATDTTWLRKVGELAENHHIVIGQRQAAKEIEAGEVLELPIEIRSWEGSLESLVKLMHELENTSDGMFDIRALNFKPSSKKGYLKGSMTLTCAYMRES